MKKEIVKKYQDAKKNFDDLCMEFNLNNKFNLSILNEEPTSYIEQIKEYQTRLYDSYDNLMACALDRFPLVKKFNKKWEADNQGYKNFGDYLQKKVEVYTSIIRKRNKQIETVLDNIGIIALPVTAALSLPAIGLGAAKFFNPDLAIYASNFSKVALGAWGVTSLDFALFYSIDKYDGKLRDVQTFVEANSKFNTIESQLENTLRDSKQRYIMISEEIQQNGDPIKIYQERMRAIDKDLVKEDVSLIDNPLFDIRIDLQNKVNCIKRNNVKKEQQKVDEANEDFKNIRREREKNSKFCAERVNMM